MCFDRWRLHQRNDAASPGHCERYMLNMHQFEGRKRDPAFRTSRHFPRNSQYRYEIRRSTQRFDDPRVSEISSAIIHARSLSRAGNVIPDPTELGSSFMPSPRGARISRLPRWGSYIVPWILCARGSRHRNVNALPLEARIRAKIALGGKIFATSFRTQGPDK